MIKIITRSRMLYEFKKFELDMNEMFMSFCYNQSEERVSHTAKSV